MKGKGLALAATAGILVFSSTLLIGQTADTEVPVTTINEPVDLTTAAEQTINGVVSIKGYTTTRGYSRQNREPQYVDPFFEYFFGPGFSQRGQRQQPQVEEREQQLGLGSGVVLSADGYIVTNNHVIDGADRLDVTLNDNRTFNATVIGTDPTTDLALIKIEASDLPVIKFGDSESLKVGEWVLAVGNPFGFTSTVTAGIVSAKGRSISTMTQTPGRQMGIESFIQTDAAVNPGNSGGALVNTRGELVGINTAIYSQTGNYAGHSFAIPTSIVAKVMGDLKQYGAVQRAVLGIETGELTSKLAEKEGITAVTSGMYIGKVVEGGSAAEAGLKQGDVITGINGHPVHTFGELQEQLSKYSPGDKITVQYVRDNHADYSVTVTLRNDQGNTRITKAGSVSDLGAVFAPVSKERMAQLNIRNGVEVKELTDGKLKSAGVKEGYIILEINNGRV
ncbi:MAG: Do family serine endopeptidase, partial [Muribaculaceae bacterium]|nr:Do family serine endopeptidase [Muribaculaceae bacterium]